MANKKYVCPICGKVWYTPNDVAACATKDAAEESKKKSEARRIEACRQSDYTNLMKRKDRITEAYNKLRQEVYTFNCEAQEYARKYRQPLIRCDVNCIFTATGGRQPWYPPLKETDKPTDPFANELRDLIRKELDF